MARFQNNFTEMFLGWPYTSIAKKVPLHWTKWPPELKMETFKLHLLLNQLTDFNIIEQKCSLGDPLPKLLKPLRSAEQNGMNSWK